MTSPLTYELEPVWPTVVVMQPCLTIRETSRGTAMAFRRIGAVEEWRVLIAYISKPEGCQYSSHMAMASPRQSLPVDLLFILK